MQNNMFYLQKTKFKKMSLNKFYGQAPQLYRMFINTVQKINIIVVTCVTFIFTHITWKGMNQTKMEGGGQSGTYLKTDDWRHRVRR